MTRRADQSGVRNLFPGFPRRLIFHETLADRIEQGPLPTDEAARVTLRLLRMIADREVRGDLRPALVVLDADGLPKKVRSPLTAVPGHGRDAVDETQIVDDLVQLLRASLPTPIPEPFAELFSADDSTRTHSLEEMRRHLERWQDRNRASTKRDRTDARQTAFPVFRDLFIGRERERTRLEESLAQNQLVTLIGPGGVGKTRLASEVVSGVVSHFESIVWVELMEEADPVHVLERVARAFGLRDTSHVDLAEEICRIIDLRSVLLVLDNAEHVVSAARDVVRRLSPCPHLHLLVTSRESLEVPGEVLLELSPLAVPELDASQPKTIADAAAWPSVALFLERTRATGRDPVLSESDLPLLLRVCRDLDGLPLALEMAAAHLRLLSLQELSDRLGAHLLDLSTRRHGGPNRHRTLRAVVEWSYAQLSPSEMRLFRALSTLPAGWTVDTVGSALAGDEEPDPVELTHDLLNKSLVQVDRAGQPSGRTRFRLLEPMRSFGLEQIRSTAEEPDLRLRIRRAFLQWGGALRASAERSPQEGARYLAEMDEEQGNLREILRWLLAESDEDRSSRIEEALRLASCQGKYWLARGALREGSKVFGLLLSLSESERFPLERAIAAGWAGVYGFHLGQLDDAERNYRISANLFDELGRARGAADSHMNLGLVQAARKQFSEARSSIEAALRSFRSLEDSIQCARCLVNLAAVELEAGNLDAAERAAHESLEESERCGDPSSRALAVHMLGETAFRQGRLETSFGQLRLGLNLHRSLRNPLGVERGLQALSRLAAELERPLEAAQLVGRAAAVRESIGARDGMGMQPEKGALLKALGPEVFERAIAFGAAAGDSEIDEALDAISTALMQG